MAPSRSSTARQTRSRTGSPYSGRPETRSRSVSQAPPDEPATPQGGQSSKQASGRHKYGLRSMLSNLIWGSPVKAVQEEQEAEDQDDDQQDEDEQGPPIGSSQEQAHVISDDEEVEDSMMDAQARYSPAEKGKGRANEQYGQSNREPVPPPPMRKGLRASHTLGDMRNFQRDLSGMQDAVTSTPSAPRQADPDSPADVNAQLATFFAAKGSASLTDDERRRIDQLLRGGPAGTQTSNTNAPTALAPNFSFNMPPPQSNSANVSILSPAYSRMPHSGTTTANMAGMAAPSTTSISGSRSLSSLASLAGPSAGTSAPASTNPRSALYRRQNKTRYIGAGYSSAAIARRERGQLRSLYSDLTSFDAPNTASQGSSAAAFGTPAKRRRVENPSTEAASYGAPPAFSQAPSPVAAPSPALSRQSNASTIQTNGSGKSSFAAAHSSFTPAKLAQVGMNANAPTSTHLEPKAAASVPRTASRTVDLMRDILGDTAEPESSKATPAPQETGIKESSTSINLSRNAQQPTLTPRERLVKQTVTPSASETLEKTMPPSLRPSANGKMPRPKPPPVPGSARKTRAAAAAEAETGKEEKDKAKEQLKQNLRVPSRSRNKSRSPSAPETPASVTKSGSEKSSKSATPDMQTDPTPANERQASKDVNMAGSDASSTPASKPASGSSSAFSFASKAPVTPAPNLFAAKSAAAPKAASAAPPKDASPAPPAKPATPAPSGMFSFTPPAVPQQRSAAEAPVQNNSTVSSFNGSAQDSMANEQQAKKAALAVSAVSLPSFSLYDLGLIFGQPSSNNDDASIRAVKQTVLERPLKELPSFQLL